MALMTHYHTSLEWKHSYTVLAAIILCLVAIFLIMPRAAAQCDPKDLACMNNKSSP